ncbi:MAG: hypothetical protein L6R35_002162 [Caloplaca aegaea]|nr:MAG: hypothetical protein L6R35_002162 [Caloplaca aegaea]
MSSFTGRFKRSRSKSEKATTPPKVVFGDLGSAYATITQKGTSGTPPSRGAIHGGLASPTETCTTWSPLQSPRSDKSASAPLLPNQRPNAIRLSHLSGDLFLPKGFGSSLPEASQVFDPFSVTGHKQDSVGPLEVKAELPDVHYDMTDGETTDASYRGPEEANIIYSHNYPDLPEDQPELCSKLSGAGQINVCDTPPPDRCGTIRRIATRHNYGEVGTNDDIRSFRGSHIHVSTTEDDGEFKGPAALQQDVTEEVQWSPRPSSELYMLDNHAAGPPSMTLPATPKNREAFKYGEPYDFSSPMAQTSHSSHSYGNTRRLLELSLPQFPHASPINDNLFQNLVNFAKEGQSSSSHGHSSKSFATFSIEDTQGNPITRPVSQREFQHLETAISTNLRRTSRTSNTAADVEFRKVGQISLTVPEGSGSEIGPGSSQTTCSSEHEPDLDFNAVRPTPRTRNGTPPLLFRSSSRVKRETDWETVGESNQTTSSVADFSDSASGTPPKSLLSVDASKVLKHPSHPRYNQSWDLQQDVHSGAFVLTPRHRLSAGMSVPSKNGVAPIPFQGARNYSHPVPLTARHRHPFVSHAPSMALSPSAVVLQQKQRPEADNKETAVESQDLSNWLNTTGTSALPAITGFADTYELSTVLEAPPLPTKNPYRQRRNFASDKQIGLQDFLSSPPRFVRRSAQKSSRNTGQVSSDMGVSYDTEAAPGIAPASSSAGPNSLVRLRSPRRRSEEINEGKRGEKGSNLGDGAGDKSHSSNPFNCPVQHQRHLTVTEKIATGDGVTEPAVAIVADTVSPPRRHARTRRSKCRPFCPLPHPVYGSGPLPECPRLKRHDPDPTPPATYEQRVARRYLAICACLPVLLPLYALRYLDFMMRIHTHGVYRAFPEWERRAAWGILVIWVMVALCVVPFATFVDRF